jgi:TolA-binding protein
MALTVSVGCGGPDPDTELTAALQAAREAAGDTTRGGEAIILLEGFVGKHPDDVGVPGALMQLAILRQQQGSMAAAIADYERILASYPTSDVADEAQFMIAFIREEHLTDLDGARTAYQAVIDNYPDSELVEQARQLLEHVGEDPDTWVPGFQGSAVEDEQ